MTSTLRYLDEVKKRASRLYGEVEWQAIGDSPTTKYYTDWRFFEKHLKTSIPATRAGGNGCTPRRGEDVLLIGGRVEQGPLPRGVRLYTIGSASSEMLSYFASLAKPEDSKILAYHYASLEQPFFIVVEETPSKVLRIAHCAPYSSLPAWDTSHIVLVVREGVEASIVLEEYGLNNTLSGYSSVVEAFIEEGASLELLKIVKGVPKAPTIHVQRTLLRENAKARTVTLATSGLMHSVDEASLLLGSRARLLHRGVIVGRGSSRGDYKHNIMHYGSKTYSRSTLYGLALDSSTIVVRGLSKIAETGKWSNTVFEATALILGSQARGYSAPMMEIDIGEVETAAHHAANYRIRRDQLFYLQSRGLSEVEAVGLLVRGILERVVENLERTKTIGEAEVEKLV